MRQWAQTDKQKDRLPLWRPEKEVVILSGLKDMFLSSPMHGMLPCIEVFSSKWQSHSQILPEMRAKLKTRLG
jgi:hypothetical protein